ncbi:hypothetical protein UFOVP26_30 [uncultured Caudovirales phage]|uniref:Cytochrome c7-like domain-containing protein n=1 Tax=uncultured Caudovirales phage TaxID=2100421 RepID=A0A6J7WVQ6_9CAUD|nr:hypothetical protein UFOVP26_30 [uncultured Caudovirales phage]CAB4123847.1 hypothetical protein UFOVP44_67 [uncultured Caudovirales phage]CAB5219283.1 hypothetical protein UFOVP220_58 [uncultured Caudovirales phage]
MIEYFDMDKRKDKDSLFDILAQAMGVVLLVLAIFTFFSSIEAKAESSCEAYRPLHAAYNLQGPHNTSMCTCSACHLGGVWKGTPNTCNGCHTGSRGIALGKNVGHIPTSASCAACHPGSLFMVAYVPHDGILTPPNGCLTCHNGAYPAAKGKPKDHPTTSASCDACHNTKSWDGASFNHAGVVKGTCNTCHNGTTATGIPRGHILTGGLSCDVCHNRGYSTFSGGAYIHSGSEQCEGCHNSTTTGVTAKPANHPLTPDNCANCHSTSGWPCKSGKLKVNLPIMYGFTIL